MLREHSWKQEIVRVPRAPTLIFALTQLSTRTRVRVDLRLQQRFVNTLGSRQGKTHCARDRNGLVAESR